MITAPAAPARPSTRMWQRLTRLDAYGAAGWYTLLTLVLTWPICARLTTQVPNDLGDPLFASWLLRWNFDHLIALAHGDFGALGRYWHAGIFYPEPLALLYAEHLFPLGVQGLPIWLATGNLLLCYNLLLLSTFVLAGVGTFLLVRDLTGSVRGAFVAGLIYAFTPYRVSQLGHIQVLSAQWMPFVLYGFHRFFVRTARPAEGSASRPLAGATLALVTQNLSCGYYLVYFAPFAAAFALWEIARRRLWRNLRMWAALALAALVVVAACLPFLLKYHEVRQLDFAPRHFEEVRRFSADTSAYLRGIDELWLWRGGFTRYHKAEGQLFPGVTPVVLAVAGLAALAVALGRRSAGPPPLSGWRLAVAAPVAVLGVAAANMARFELFAGRRIWRIRNAWPWLADIRHVFLVVAACGLVLIVLSPRARAFARLGLSSVRVFFAAALCLSVWLSFGPLVMTLEHGIAPDALYGWLHHNVPGFNGLRVPARYGMLAMLFLAVLAGYGAAAIDRLRRARWVVPALAAFFLLEAASMPVPVKRIEWSRQDGIVGAVSAGELERLYTFVRNLPRGTVVAEFPFGRLEGEVRAVYLSTRHGHPILNGYSGAYPAAYDRRAPLLADPVLGGDAAWQAILDSGATCLIVHQWAFEPGHGVMLSEWLERHGAVPLATFKTDRLFLVQR